MIVEYGKGVRASMTRGCHESPGDGRASVKQKLNSVLPTATRNSLEHGSLTTVLSNKTLTFLQVMIMIPQGTSLAIEPTHHQLQQDEKSMRQATLAMQTEQ